MIIDEPVRTKILSCVCDDCGVAYKVKLWSPAPKYTCSPAQKAVKWYHSEHIETVPRRYIQEYEEMNIARVVWRSKEYASAHVCEACGKKPYYDSIKKEVYKNDN